MTSDHQNIPERLHPFLLLCMFPMCLTLINDIWGYLQYIWCVSLREVWPNDIFMFPISEYIGRYSDISAGSILSSQNLSESLWAPDTF
jgi:hypothetical protein